MIPWRRRWQWRRWPDKARLLAARFTAHIHCLYRQAGQGGGMAASRRHSAFADHYFTRNFALLFSVLDDVVTSTKPVVAPAGTVAMIRVSDVTVNAAAVPLNVTLVALERLSPRICTVLPTLPDDSSVLTNGFSPTDKLKSVPLPVPP